MKKYILLLVLSLLLVGCVKEPLTTKEKLKMIVASDIHYFLKDYYKDCDWFEDMMLQGDGKMVTYADEILDAFEQAIINEKPELVVLSGDLTFNGEKGSHEGLAKRLQKIQDQGIQVAVLPGNHDIDNIYTKGYGKDDYIEVENINAKDFEFIYQNFGYKQAVKKHKDSLSYVLSLNNDFTLVMLDTNHHEQTTGNSLSSGGSLPESTLNWTQKQLESIKKEGKTPLIVMHHNLAVHNDLLNAGYTINDNEKIADMFVKYHVPFVLSGHIHCQNIKQIKGIYDIASSSLLDAPLQYGVIELEKQHMSYHTQSLQISVDSAEYFQKVSYNRMKENFVNQKDGEEALKTMSLINYHYFAGTLGQIKDDLLKSKGYQILKNIDNEFTQNYLKSMMEDAQDQNHLDITF